MYSLDSEGLGEIVNIHDSEDEIDIGAYSFMVFDEEPNLQPLAQAILNRKASQHTDLEI